MLAAGIVFGILLLLILMAGMWLAFNMNDYGVNDWVDDEEDNVAERRNRENRLEAQKLEEVNDQTIELERRRVLEERRKVRGREEVYCISKHSPSVSLDSAISVGSPLDSTGKTSIVSHQPSPNLLYQKPPWETSPSAFTLVFSSAETFRPGSTYPTPTSPHPLPRSDHLTISLPPKSDIQAIRVVREMDENPPKSPSHSTQTPDLSHKDPATQSKTVETSSPGPGMFSPTPTPEHSIPKSSASPSILPPASSRFASPSASPSPPVCATSSPPSTPASPHSAQISVLLESLPSGKGEALTAMAAWPKNVAAAKEEEHNSSFEEGFDQITLAENQKPTRPVSTSYKLESLKLAAARAAVAPAKG